MSANNPHNIAVGQKLWFVPAKRGGAPREITAGKVGRVYFEETGWSGIRFRLTNLQGDGRGFSSPGQCHLSRDEYEAEEERQDEWSRMATIIRNTYRAPQDVTIEGIREAKRLLGI